MFYIRFPLKNECGGEEGMNRLSLEDFQNSKTALHNTTVVDTCHGLFAQTHGMYKKTEPQCKLWASGDNDVSM